MTGFLLLSVCLLLVEATLVEESWSRFQVKHNKIYKGQPEQQLREKIYNNNLQIIEEHNKKYEQGLSSYKLGVNQFADLTDEEFAAKFKTILADEKVLQRGQQEYSLTNNVAVPESIDWRTKSVVTEVKNQGSCGGCWAISATGTIESRLAIQTGVLKPLSEQQLLDCDRAKNKGCSGGVVEYAIDYVTANGLTSEDNYPYRAVQQSCNTSKVKDVAATTYRYVSIRRNNEVHLKRAVATGPVSVAINSGPIKLYREGIFDGTCSNAIDHAVLAVGYGRDSQTGAEYWIIKNSWGANWGDQGYFKLLMGKNLCGVARQACYPITDPNSGYSTKGGVFLVLLASIYLLLN